MPDSHTPAESPHASIELALSADGPAVLSLPIEGGSAMLGRAPSNDVAFTDSRISWHHALIWTEGGGAWVRDLSSTNGTFIGDEAVTQPTRLSEGTIINLGKAADLWVRRAGKARQVRRLALEDLGTGLIFPLFSDRFILGAGPDVDLPVPGAQPDDNATLMIYEENEVWLGVDTVASPLELDVPFEVAGHRYQIRELSDDHAPTEVAHVFRYPYRLTIPFSGTLPIATFEDPQASLRCEVTADNRVALLYVLSQRLLEDRRRDGGSPTEGWCTDQEVGVSVWGRTWHEQTTNNLHVIIHRLRSQLKSAGFDPWCIEKKRGKVRLRIQDLDIT